MMQFETGDHIYDLVKMQQARPCTVAHHKGGWELGYYAK